MAFAAAIIEYLLKVEEGLVQDAAQKGQKFPVDKMRAEADDKGGKLYGPHYIKYLILGRGPGKAPPPIKMQEWVEANPDVLARAQQVYKYITGRQLAFLIGRKIAREGTDIFSGKKPGIDLLGVMEKNMPDLLSRIGQAEAFRIATLLKQAVK